MTARSTGPRGCIFEVKPGWGWAGGGLYAPSTADLPRPRARRDAPHPVPRHRGSTRLQTTVRRPQGRPPDARAARFPSDHPAAEFLTFKQYLAWREFPGDFAVSPRFYRGLLDVFRAAAPLVRYLNTALKGANDRQAHAPRPLLHRPRSLRARTGTRLRVDVGLCGTQ